MDEQSEEPAYHSHSHHTHPHHEHELWDSHHPKPPVWIEIVCVLFLFVILPGSCGLLFLSDAALRTISGHKQGVITRTNPVYHSFLSRGGATKPMYVDNEVYLANDSTAYVLFRDEFQPQLPAELYSGGKVNEAAEIWYQYDLFASFHPEIIAIKVLGGHQNGTLYATAAYRQPQQTEGNEYGLALITLLLPVFILVSLALWAQGRRHRKQHYALTAGHAHAGALPARDHAPEHIHHP